MRVSCGDGPGQLSSTFYYSNSSLSVSMTASRRASGLATLPFSAATRVFLFYLSPTPAPAPPAAANHEGTAAAAAGSASRPGPLVGAPATRGVATTGAELSEAESEASIARSTAASKPRSLFMKQ